MEQKNFALENRLLCIWAYSVAPGTDFCCVQNKSISSFNQLDKNYAFSHRQTLSDSKPSGDFGAFSAASARQVHQFWIRVCFHDLGYQPMPFTPLVRIHVSTTCVFMHFHLTRHFHVFATFEFHFLHHSGIFIYRALVKPADCCRR